MYLNTHTDMKNHTRPTRSTRAVTRCRPEHKKAIEQAAKLERARLELEDMRRPKGR